MNIIKKYHIKAKKSLWQNFLVDIEKLFFISNKLEIKWKNIVEVGPWYGALTEKLLEKKPKALNLIELDNNMVNILKDRIESWDLKAWKTNLTIENIDVLKYFPDFENYFVIANIPYYITSPILRHFFYDVKNTPEKMLILMQKDVWDKILKGVESWKLKVESKSWKNTSPLAPLPQGTLSCPKAGTIHLVLQGEGDSKGKGRKNKKIKNSVLSLFMQKKSYISEVLLVGKECFSPSPKVDSSVLLFEKHNLYEEVDDKDFLEFIKLAFSENRKKLSKNLAKKYKKEDILKIFKENNIWENTRAEELDIALYCKLVWVFNNILNKNS